MAAIPSIPFLATYLALLVLPLVAAGLLAITRLPPAPPRVAQHLPLRDILARPAFRAAVAAGMVGYGAMSLVMTATPLQMSFCGLAVGASADVVAAHSVAMFLPGFATGRLIDRFGTHPIICAGAILIAVCVAIDIAFAPLLNTFYAALILLGAGWNFMFVGGTALLAEAHDAHERVRVQATNDFIVFGTAAAASFASGAIEAIGGWSSLNLSVVPPLLVAVAIVSWHWTARERLAPVG